MAPDEPWRGEPDPDLPPPTPFERPVIAPPVIISPPVQRDPRRRTFRIALLMLVAAGVGFVAGLAVPLTLTLPGGLVSGPSMPVDDGEPDAGLVELLETVIRTEGEMLAFNDAVAEQLGDAQDEETAFAGIASAAASASDELAELRPVVVEQRGHPAIDDVRTAYLPHLDAWIDYLAALAERPELLFSDEDQQPFLLDINATAADFSDALEALLASDPVAEVAQLAQRILDDGFRGMGADAQV
jgi:hypothetical protein